MTNDEAIYVLKNTAWLGSEEQAEKVSEAVQMAIEALQRNECVTDAIRVSSSVLPTYINTNPMRKNVGSAQDCVDRQAAIDICHKNYDGILDFRSDGRTVALSFEDIINSVPSVQPELCEDAVSREAVSKWLKQYGQDVLHGKYKFSLMYIWKNLMDLPSVQPTYTEAQLQKMQDMHQAEIEKAFDLGRESARSEIIRCKDCKHKGTKNCVANAWTTIFGVTIKDDFYCGLAERRTDGTD